MPVSALTIVCGIVALSTWKRNATSFCRDVVVPGARPNLPAESNQVTPLILAAKHARYDVASLIITRCSDRLGEAIEATEADSGNNALMWGTSDADGLTREISHHGVVDLVVNCC